MLFICLWILVGKHITDIFFFFFLICGGQSFVPGTFLNFSLPFFQKWCLQWTWRLLVQPKWRPASFRDPPVSSLSPLGSQAHSTVHCFLCGFQGHELKSSCLSDKLFTNSHFPSSNFIFLTVFCVHYSHGFFMYGQSMLRYSWLSILPLDT